MEEDQQQQTDDAEQNELFRGSRDVGEVEISDCLKKCLQKMGITRLTRIQYQAFTPMVEPGDVLIKAQTGSGKTLAYCIPIVELLSRASLENRISRTDGTLALIMIPTRELAMQVEKVLSPLTSLFPFMVVGTLSGGEQKKKEKARLRKGVTLLIATPGRLLDHLQTTRNFVVGGLKHLVFDEADRLLDMGFRRDIDKIFSILKNEKGVTNPKVALVSATLDQQVKQLAHVTLTDPKMVGFTEPAKEGEDTEAREVVEEADVADCDVTLPTTLQQHVLHCDAKWRGVTLVALVHMVLKHKNAKKVIVFCSCCDSVEFHHELFSLIPHDWKEEQVQQEKDKRGLRGKAYAGTVEFLDPEDEDTEFFQEAQSSLSKGPEEADNPNLFTCNLFKMHGNLTQNERVGIMNAFTKAETGVLFATDVASRGLDLPNVDWIIQYDDPGPERIYVHRVGRTARIGNVGNSVLFLQPHEEGYLKLLHNYNIRPKRMRWDQVLFYMAQLWKTGTVMDAAGHLQGALFYTVSKRAHLNRLAILGFQATVRAYHHHPKRLTEIFDVKNLHTGHLARSFGIAKGPSALATAKHLKMEKKSGKFGRQKAFQQDHKHHHQQGEQYVPGVVVKQQKRDKEIEIAKQEAGQSKKRPLSLTTMGEFDSCLPGEAPQKKQKAIVHKLILKHGGHEAPATPARRGGSSFGRGGGGRGSFTGRGAGRGGFRGGGGRGGRGTRGRGGFRGRGGGGPKNYADRSNYGSFRRRK